jgi:hypothetical protein
LNTDRPESSTQAISPSSTALSTLVVADPLRQTLEVAERTTKISNLPIAVALCWGDSAA